MRRRRIALLVAGITACQMHAETGHDAWLRYQRLPEPVAASDIQALGDSITLRGNSEVLPAARSELSRGLLGMLGRVPRLEVAEAVPADRFAAGLPADGFRIQTVRQGSVRYTVVAGGTDRGVLYGVFALLRKIALEQPINSLDVTEVPYAPLRWVNQWDNLDGSIERGYGGRSIFWEDRRARSDLSRVSDYGRLLASIGINACSINNVNADPRVLSTEMLPEIARIAGAFRRWGVRAAISVDFASPKTLGGLDTFDPLDPRVAAWWRAKVDELYRAIPDLAGIIIKADSEGRAGPSAYGRTHADAANMVASALQPHGGLLFYRGFVYDHHMDWRNRKNDRARAADDNFRPLDGKFESNAVIQIKNGPIDFQVREPASPLFGTLEKTNEAIELQITQEYLGQARHTVFLAPMWKEVLDFDMHAKGEGTPVKALVAGKVFGQWAGGFVGVSNVGLDDNWFGNQLSQANLYAFGRLAWNPDLSAREISEEWTRLTFGSDPTVNSVVNEIQLSSWRTYENYTGPLGLQTLTDITGNHYGVNVEASERNGWGQWHNADKQGVGMDRSVTSGTGFAGQYRPDVAKMYESAASTPDELLLFFHHVPYTYRLHSGKMVIQSLYDSHYAGAEAATNYVREWRTLQGLIDQQRYHEVLAQLEYQAGQAEVWRDAVVNWFLKESDISDEKGRAGNHPGRVEAESMQLEGYTPVPVTPWEAASGIAISCPISQCAASFVFHGRAGRHDVRIRYFDQNNGAARFRVLVNGEVRDEWVAWDHLPSKKIDGTTSSLRIVAGVALKPGDEIRIEGSPDGGESAALDYVEIQ
ncbi:MAG TPA: alpha-glucuronidase family glycosyl hydrolase [Bryobacteraceae bacterium]|nr:alpha-glucuronidase family glycosyl hydrolase [Bryobacteraceae bacterium]